MRKIFTLGLLFLLACVAANARQITGVEADHMISGADMILPGTKSDIPEFVHFKAGARVAFSAFESWAHERLGLPAGYSFQLLNAESDALGMTHYRYQQTFNGLPLVGTMFIVHVKNGMIVSVNGMLFNTLSVSRAASLDEPTALTKALSYMNASLYRWQVPAREAQLKAAMGPAATWYPKGEQVLAPAKGIMKGENYRLAYRFDVYAEQPVKREYVFVDATTGEVIYSINRIRESNSTATAVTRYSGNRTIITDSVNATTYRLRETGRGQGIETYNSQTTTNHPQIDFTDTDNFWNNVNPAQDEVATDAHWGAEMTYDFYQVKFGRNSIDNAGQKLLSYVHFDVNLVNANWDGTEMNYGDGDMTQGYGPLTCLDVTGHEISHGLTENTSNLNYQDESGAMNEAFSDCMGNSIRQFGKNNATINWLIGDEMGGTPFRDMSNPNVYGQPDTYLGTNWYTGTFDNGGVHTNSGVMNFWFYLLTEGGAGTNDNNDTYSVSGLGIDSAAAICYRMNAVYLTPGSQYADARFYSIQAANDLYGACSHASIQTTNAWYAVGVGSPFDSTVSVSFVAPQTVYCTSPALVQFNSTSNNIQTYVWDFGDGSPRDTTINATVTHNYTGYGHYNVMLIGDGGACGGLDTATQLQYISVDTLNPCVVWMPASGTAQTQTTCGGYLYDNGGPTGNYTDQSDVTMTIAPVGAASVTLNFTLFDLENNFDFLYIYDGPNTTSPQFGSFTGNALPMGGTIISSGGAITLRMTSDQALNLQGFALSWQCTLSTVPPVTAFSADHTTSCTGVINFTDHSTQGPTSWAWDFGDGDSSHLQSPQHVYTTNGTYTVRLATSNANGSDTLIQSNYITINLPAAPTSADDSVCAGSSATLTAVGTDTLNWYNQSVGGAPLSTGPVFNTPPVMVPTTFYVSNEVPQTPVHVGPLDNTIGAGGNYNNNQYRNVIFNCYVPVKLVSVLVYAQGAGNRTIELHNSGGTVLQSATVNIPNGASRVTLNFDLPIGNDLELGAAGGVNLYRNSAGATYPYTLNGIVTITGNNADPARYYFFYDWELQEAACSSARVPVHVGIVSSPVSAFTVATNLDTATFTDQSQNTTSWSWNFGDPNSGVNNTSNLPSPVHVFSDTGYYNVCLVTTQGACTDTACQTVLIHPTGIQPITATTGILVYPNPVSNELVIAFNQQSIGSWKAQVSDMVGKTVGEKMLSGGQLSGPFRWDVSFLAPGAYFLTLDNGSQKFVKQIIRQ